MFGLYERKVLAQAARGSYTTTADVSLRSGPGMKYPVVTTLPKGTNINVVRREGYWLKVELKYGGQPGYVDEQFAQPVETTQAAPKVTTTPVAGAYKTIKDVDLRQGPGAKYPVVAKIPSGIRVKRRSRGRRLVKSRIQTRRQAEIPGEALGRTLGRSILKLTRNVRACRQRANNPSERGRQNLLLAAPTRM